MGEFRQSQRKIGKHSKTYTDVCRNNTAIMLHLSAWFYCCTENQSAILVTKEKRALNVYTHILKCRFPHGLCLPGLSWANEEASDGSWTDHTSQTAQRQTIYVSILAQSTLLSSILASFHPAVFPFSLSHSILVPPCNQGPLKWAEETD